MSNASKETKTKELDKDTNCAGTDAGPKKIHYSWQAILYNTWSHGTGKEPEKKQVPTLRKSINKRANARIGLKKEIIEGSISSTEL